MYMWGIHVNKILFVFLFLLKLLLNLRKKCFSSLTFFVSLFNLASFVLRIALKMKSRITVYYSQKYLSPLFIFPSAVSVYFVICYNCPRFAFLFNCSSFKVPVARKQRLPWKYYASSFNAYKAITSLQCNPSCLPMTHREAVCKKKKRNKEIDGIILS